MTQIPKTYTYKETKDKKITINNLNSNFTEVKTYTFYKCNDLEEIDMSENTYLKSVNTYAFYNCPNLKKISFKNCTSLEYFDMYFLKDINPDLEIDLTGCNFCVFNKLSLKFAGNVKFIGLKSLFEKTGDSMFIKNEVSFQENIYKYDERNFIAITEKDYEEGNLIENYFISTTGKIFIWVEDALEDVLEKERNHEMHHGESRFELINKIKTLVYFSGWFECIGKIGNDEQTVQMYRENQDYSDLMHGELDIYGAEDKQICTLKNGKWFFKDGYYSLEEKNTKLSADNDSLEEKNTKLAADNDSLEEKNTKLSADNNSLKVKNKILILSTIATPIISILAYRQVSKRNFEKN